MRIVVFGPDRRVGAMRADAVVDLSATYAACISERGVGRPYAVANANVPAGLQEFIESGPAALDGAREALEFIGDATEALGLRGEPLVLDASAVRFHAPIPSMASRFMMAGGNYADHLRGAQSRSSGQHVSRESVIAQARAQGPWHFVKATPAVIGDGDPLIYPARADHLDDEGEIAVILGRRGKDLQSSDLADFTWGYVLVNDWSIRNITNIMDFGYFKNFDGCTTLGPHIVVDEISDPQDIPQTTRVNGEVRQSSSTKEMIFGFAEFLGYLSRDFTLHPGDLISGGSPAGTAMDSSEFVDGCPKPDLFLRPGDVVEVSSPLIGTITNEVHSKPVGAARASPRGEN